MSPVEQKRLYNRERYRKKRIEMIKAATRYQQAHPEQRATTGNRYYLKKKYGLTVTQVAAMSVRQRHRCAICNEKTELVIDHCHRFGHVRSLLCQSCNKMIGFAREEPDILARAIVYLQKGRKNDSL